MTDKKYKIKDIFYSIQGEGFNMGKPAIFIRFSGCNLWSGSEKDRENAVCKFCDTDFKGTDGENGGIYSPVYLLKKIIALSSNCKFLIFTGGEPLLQLDEHLLSYLNKHDYFMAVETNGTIKAPDHLDWITVSPKYGSELVQKSGNELKFVFPQTGFAPEQFQDLDFQHFFLQPKYDENLENNTSKSLEFCLKNPKWRLSLQTHKFLGIK
ncbi:MAG: 7-carboxy-7-deazaguanine synthase [Saprospiraceae bacterium]|nr:7-carboxy-7-deazaguanine synthase [Saprospiraceae bacterium]